MHMRSLHRAVTNLVTMAVPPLVGPVTAANAQEIAPYVVPDALRLTKVNVILAGVEAPSNDNGVRALQRSFASIRNLENGWDGANSIALRPAVLARAGAILSFALQGHTSSSMPRLVPISDGSMQAEWHNELGDFEMYFEADGELAAWRRDRCDGSEHEAEGSEAAQMLAVWIQGLGR